MPGFWQIFIDFQNEATGICINNSINKLLWYHNLIQSVICLMQVEFYRVQCRRCYGSLNVHTFLTHWVEQHWFDLKFLFEHKLSYT